MSQVIAVLLLGVLAAESPSQCSDIWDLATISIGDASVNGVKLRNIPILNGMSITSADVSPDGRFLAVETHFMRAPREKLLTTRDQVEIFEISTRKSLKKAIVAEDEWEQVAVADSDPQQERFLRYTSDGTRLIFSDGNKRRLLVLSADDLSQIHEFPAPRNPLGTHVYALATAARAPIAAALWSVGGLMRPKWILAYYDLDKGTELGNAVFDLNRLNPNVALSPDGKLAALSVGVDQLHKNNPTAVVVSIPEGKLVSSIRTDYVIRPLVFDVHGRLLTGLDEFGNNNNLQIKIWDVGTGKFITQLEQTKEGINGLAVSPNGEQVAGLVHVEKYRGGMWSWFAERQVESVSEGFVVWDAENGTIKAVSSLNRFTGSSSQIRISNNWVILMYERNGPGKILKCH